jgi:hypothetical protein
LLLPSRGAVAPCCVMAMCRKSTAGGRAGSAGLGVGKSTTKANARSAIPERRRVRAMPVTRKIFALRRCLGQI